MAGCYYLIIQPRLSRRLWEYERHVGVLETLSQLSNPQTCYKNTAIHSFSLSVDIDVDLEGFYG